MTEHTPGPWRILISTGRNQYRIATQSSRTIAHVYGIANARLIVTACNSHADLLEALKEISKAGLVGRDIYAVYDNMKNVALDAILKYEESQC